MGCILKPTRNSGTLTEREAIFWPFQIPSTNTSTGERIGIDRKKNTQISPTIDHTISLSTNRVKAAPDQVIEVEPSNPFVLPQYPRGKGIF